MHSTIKKMPFHSLNVCNFLRTLTMASELKITSLVNTLIYTKQVLKSFPFTLLFADSTMHDS